MELQRLFGQDMTVSQIFSIVVATVQLGRFLAQKPPVSWVFSMIVASSLLYFVIITIHRIYYHPLSIFPGPKIAAATQLYEFYHDVIRGGQYQFLIQDWHKIYGPVVRISPFEVCVNDPEFYDELYTGGGRGGREKWAFVADMTSTPTSYFSAVDHDLHRRRRKPVDGFFSKRDVVQLSPIIKQHIEKLCKRIKEWKGTNRPLSLRYAYAALTLDVVSQYAFANPYGALDDPGFAPQWLDALESIITGCYLNVFFPWLPRLMKKLPLWMAKLLNPHIVTVIQYQKGLSEQIQAIMDSPEEKGESSHRTIFHEFLQSPDLPPEDRNIIHFAEEAQNIVGAGQITTAANLSSTTFHVLNNPDVSRKLRQELEAAIPDPNSLPSLIELEQLPYLNAVINEGYRLSTGNVIHRIARVSPTQPIVYTPSGISESLIFPAGVPISMSSLSLHNNSSIFPDPKIFDPERWLQPTSQQLKRYLVPFGKGSRSCIGQNLAQAETYITLAAMFRRFDFELYDTVRERDIDPTQDFIPGWPSKGSKGVRVLVKE